MVIFFLMSDSIFEIIIIWVTAQGMKGNSTPSSTSSQV
jgi:hypothetical protein